MSPLPLQALIHPDAQPPSNLQLYLVRSEGLEMLLWAKANQPSPHVFRQMTNVFYPHTIRWSLSPDWKLPSRFFLLIGSPTSSPTEIPTSSFASTAPSKQKVYPWLCSCSYSSLRYTLISLSCSASLWSEVDFHIPCTSWYYSHTLAVKPYSCACCCHTFDLILNSLQFDRYHNTQHIVSCPASDRLCDSIFHMDSSSMYCSSCLTFLFSLSHQLMVTCQHCHYPKLIPHWSLE